MPKKSVIRKKPKGSKELQTKKNPEMGKSQKSQKAKKAKSS